MVGPTGRLECGLKLAREEDLDGAILDINLHGERCFAIAEMLAQRGVPFLFLTGYSDPTIVPAALRWAHRLSKPVADNQLLAVAGELFSACAE